MNLACCGVTVGVTDAVHAEIYCMACAGTSTGARSLLADTQWSDLAGQDLDRVGPDTITNC